MSQVKDSEESLTEDEIQILMILEEHAKESIDEIAKRCGFSRQKVWRIVKQLEEKKIIWGYSAITDAKEKGGYFTLLIKRSMVALDDPMKKEIITEKLNNHLPSGIKIEHIIITHGEWDVVVTFYAPDLLSAKKVVESMFERIGKYCREILLLENLFPVRKNGMKNPNIKKLVEYI